MAAWQGSRPSNGDGGYGSSVEVNGTSRPQFTAVTTSAGKVTGWHQVFPAKTRVARAEADVRGALPADVRQTASWRGSFLGGAGTCEFVTYHSVSLTSRLGTAISSPGESNIGVEFYEVTPYGTRSPSIATVNSAQVSNVPFHFGQPC